MLQKFKDLMQVKDMLVDISAEIKKQNQEFELVKLKVSTLVSNLGEIRCTMAGFEKEQKDYTQRIIGEFTEISQAKQEFIDEINDFKLKKTQMQKQMMERADTELKDSLDRVKTDVMSYNELKRDIETVSNSISTLKANIDKFTSISSRIKETDFEASKFAKKIFDTDQEKLRLMKEIDSLKFLISKERRNRR